MSFGKLKRALKGLINRKDLTDELAGDFINRAVDAIERDVRVESMKLLVSSDFDGSANTILIPADYLEMVDLFTDEKPLIRVEKAQYLRTDMDGPPAVFLRAGSVWMIRPTPAAGSKVYVEYYAETPPLVSDVDESIWSRAAFDAVLYGAASLAADYFQMEDPYVQRFQGKADILIQSIDAQDYDDRWSGPQQISDPIGRGNY